MDGCGSSIRFSLFFQKGSIFQFLERALKFRLCVHDNRPVPGYGLTQRFSRNQQESDTCGTRFNRDLVAVAEECEAVILDLRSAAKLGGSFEYISERVMV